MKQSQLFCKTRREGPKDEVARNAELLIRAGYIHKEMAGVYSFLPLGLRVIEKIKQIVREEMNAIGGEELHLATLQDPEVWAKTDRWNDSVVDVWFKTKLKNDSELGLAPTHEEPLTSMMLNHIHSYKDLPVYVYQFQTKFRNELRSRSGILRGREFLMKDLYSFTTSQEELDKFYEKAAGAYEKIFKRVGIGDVTYRTLASGGMFSKWSDEFQTITKTGEDTIYLDEKKGIAVNGDVYGPQTLDELGLKEKDLQKKKAIEVGNIFKLGTKYSQPLGLVYQDTDGVKKPVVMGSYGIGITRLMGAIVEVFADSKGLVWPKEIAPFQVHLILLEKGKSNADKLYKELTENGIEVLYDDRDLRAGEKFADSDLLGIPARIIVSEKSNEKAGFEVVDRRTGMARMAFVTDLKKEIK
ncbi:MAG TPA: aminoacyl--tRNA ligase-related protein [Candidatus Paceibacterota bacterium]